MIYVNNKKNSKNSRIWTFLAMAPPDIDKRSNHQTQLYGLQVLLCTRILINWTTPKLSTEA